MDTVKQKSLLNKYLPIISNILIFVFAIIGNLFSFLYAERDGYSPWWTRLLYFTQQSNFWIGATSLIFAIILIKGTATEKHLKTISIFKYIFTVSITITGIVFCTLLAPFADFNVWQFSSVLTHVIVPILSIFDFFTNKNIVKLDKKHVWYSLFPMLFYFVFASILCVLKVDFGRGDPYPYFFLDFYSEVGLFGFIAKWPPQIGSFYWLVFFFGFIYLLSFTYYKIHVFLMDKKRRKDEEDSSLVC